MTDQRIVFKNLDGSVGVITPSKDSGDIETLAERSVPEGLEWGVIAVNVLASREFRNAWVDFLEGPQIDISCEKARDISLAEMREKRNELLDNVDKEVNRATDNDDTETIADLKARRILLRDSTEPLKALAVTGEISNATLLDQIRNLAIVE